jgi:VanZ like family
LLLAIIIAAILYGSLYPFRFREPVNGIGAIRTLLEGWAQTPRRVDFLVNVLLYMPLGFSEVFAVAAKTRLLGGICLATITGALLSICMEVTQYYVAERVTAASDVYANVIGTALGAIIAGLTYKNFRWPPARAIAANRVPCLLLGLWLGYRLFPYVPTIDLHKYWDALKPVVLNPSLTEYDLFRYTAIWLTIGALIEAIGGRKRSWLLFALFITLVLAAKVLIVGKTLSIAEIAGGGSALGVWLLLTLGVGARLRVSIVALLFCAVVVAERLAPLQFSPHGRDFGWIPFLGFIHGSLEVNILSFLEKAFAYGSLIWLIGKTGFRLGTSTILVTLLLFATSWAETYLVANRSGEITDAVLALLMGTIIALMEDENRGTASLGIEARLR